jgi:hypothetical protein
VRFTDVNAEQMERIASSARASGGPPSDVPSSGVTMLFDEEQGTAVILQYYATAENMRSGAETMGALDISETPGTRASVDMCELKLEVEA